MKTQSDALQDFMSILNDAPRKLNFAVQETALPLMPHQVEATKFALERQRVLLAMEMGTGKSPTAVAISQSSVEAGMRPMLIVCPPTMRLQFKREFARFAPQLSVHTITGTNPVKQGITSLPDVDVLIMGDTSADGYKNLLKGHVKGIIVDECQRIKGGKRAKRSQAVIDISQSIPLSGIRVMMSGTPLINRPMELLPVINGLEQQGAFEGGVRGYMARYAPRIDNYGTRGAQRLNELHDVLVGSFMLRMKRSDVLELPNKGRMEVAMEMEAKYEKLYRYAEANLYEWIRMTKGQEKANNVERAEALIRINELRKLSALGKVNGVVDYVRELLDNDEQVFITCAFKEEAKRYMDAFADVNAVQVVGGMNDSAKMASVDAFQSGHARVLIGNIIASGTGLTLTSARHHVSASLPWTSADLLQCEDRLQRIGQKRDVVSHIMLSAIEEHSTIDERMIQIIMMKNRILSSVLDGEADDLLDDERKAVAMLVLESYGWEG